MNKKTLNENNLEKIQNAIFKNNLTIGHKIYYYPLVQSTMNVAKKLVEVACPHGSLIIAASQNGGRGRMSRTWVSPVGGLWFSIILTPSIPPSLFSKITLAAGISVCEVIQELYNIKPGLKWPNDVLLNNKKVCGILTESLVESNIIKHAILGIGINLNFYKEELPEELYLTGSTILSETGKYLEPEIFLHKLLIRLNEKYSLLESQRIFEIDRYKNFSITLGKQVTAIYHDKEIFGLAKDINGDGNLIIELENGENIEVCSGEVSIRVLGSYS